MHGKKKRLLSTVYSYIGKGLSKPLARVHPGYTFALGSEAENINVWKAVFLVVELSHIKKFN